MGKPTKSAKQGANANYCKVYKQEGREDINRRRKMMRHLRNHPAALDCAKALTARFGLKKPEDIGTTTHGKRRLAHALVRAARKAKRLAQRQQAAVIASEGEFDRAAEQIGLTA